LIVKKGGFRPPKKGVFGGTKRGFFGGEKGGFLIRGRFAACFCEFTRVLLKICRVFEVALWGNWINRVERVEKCRGGVLTTDDTDLHGWIFFLPLNTLKLWSLS
jgi:hypothetical protein